jgi:FlaA1/EpsC-like NDP-sugar epimerase
MINSIKSRLLQIFKDHSLPRWLVLLIDMTVVFFSFLIAYILRYNFETYSFEISLALRQASLVFVIYTFFMLVFKSFNGMIRHTTIKDTYKILRASFAALAILIVLTLLSRKNEWELLFNIPLSILFIHAGAVIVLLFLFRVLIKFFYEFALTYSYDRKNVLIYGTGEMGILVKRLLEGDSKSQYRLKGFIDDNKKLQGKKVDGFPVYTRDVLTKEFIKKEEIKVFIISINKIEPARKKEVIEFVIELGCEILDTPTFDTWLNGSLEVKNLKKVKIEDLLGREPITLDLKKIEEGLTGKTILVTGAAGSIGSEIVRQLTKFNPKQLILIDQAETPSFYLNNELMDNYPYCHYHMIIGDVTNEPKMNYLFRKYRPEIIFHAAAYKHVPLMETNPHEAFRVNVGGTKIISELAIKYKAEKFVMISTDKAVNPTNVMGATKKICELLVQAQARRSGTKSQFVTTRFGNVLGSNGSVIPLFKKQIEDGGPVTVTHPDITRFFMTIPEACQLVLEAGFMGNGGEIFIFDMGSPIKILDIATKLIHLSGLKPHEDIKIEFTGLRPGEKLYEELFSNDEPQIPTHNPKISIARLGEINYERVLNQIDAILRTIYDKTGSELIKDMMEIVPGYNSKFELVERSISELQKP